MGQSLLETGASIRKWGIYYKVGQDPLLKGRSASRYYKMGQVLFKIGAKSLSQSGDRYYKMGQLLQSRVVQWIRLYRARNLYKSSQYNKSMIFRGGQILH